jgi:hypothetical protein
VPFVRPVTTIVSFSTSCKTPIIPSGNEVAVKLVISEPPSLDGAVNAILANPFPAVASPITGAVGVVLGSSFEQDNTKN